MTQTMTRTPYLEAISAAMREEMRRDERVFLLGEDVGFNALGSSPGFIEEFGPERVRNTPISEAGFVGAAAGAAMVGMRPIVDVMMPSFMYCAMDQIVSIIAKSTYLYGGQAKLPITLRAAMFYGCSVAAQHSDRPLSTFMTIPGLKIIAPSNAYDAKGLLKTAIRDDDPVICFEEQPLWMSSMEIPDEEYLIPLGVADIKRPGTDVTVVGVAGAVQTALGAADQLAREGVSIEVIDIRSLVPLDTETILNSVARTGHLVVVDPSHALCSVASEISATVAERGFWHLQAPIRRVTTPHTHIPFSPPLERDLFPTVGRVVDAVRAVLS